MSKEKKVITKAEFEKRIEIEYCFIIYTENVRKDDAWRKARETISQKYIVE